MKKVFVLCAAALLLLTSCSNALFMKYMNYPPPKTAGSSDDKKDDGEFEEDGEGGEDAANKVIQIAAAFKYILPNGQIDPMYAGDKAALQAKFSPAIASLNSAVLSERLFKIDVIDANQIPTMHFKNSGEWTGGNAAKNETKYKGDNFDAMGYANTNIWFYRYKSKNPFYGGESFYNLSQFVKTDGTSKESVMERFQFYKWTGENTGQYLDTHMIALDTYTGLVWGYAKISKWFYMSIASKDVPTEFSPIELYHGKHRFYEYDPSGYIDADGSVVLEQWYKTSTSSSLQSQFDNPPPRTGKSPYYVADGTEKIDALLQEKAEVPVSGVISVRLNYIKNVNITPEIPVLGSTDALFYWDVSANGYSGDEAEAPPAVQISLKPHAERSNLNKGNIVYLNNLVNFKFVNKQQRLVLDIKSIINFISAKKIISLPDWLGGNQTIEEGAGGTGTFNLNLPFTYDRNTHRWVDETGTHSVGIGEELTFSLQDSANAVEANYTVSWQRESSSTDKGRIITPSIRLADEHLADIQCTLDGLDADYALEYFDADYDSAAQEKNITLKLQLNNMLDDGGVITLRRSTFNSTAFIQNLKLDGATMVRRGDSFGTAAIPLTFTLGSDSWNEQTEDILILVSYPATGYDLTYSPKEIKISVKRQRVGE